MDETETFQLNNIGEFEYFNIPKFDSAGKRDVFTFFSTRNGGVSEGCYSSLNLGTKKLDDKRNVRENYEILCRKLNFDIESFAFSDQIHRDNILRVAHSDAAFPLFKQKIFNADALITDDRDLPLITFYADCVPLYFFDPVNEVIGLAHAGWRGTVMQIGPKVVKKMTEQFGTDPGKLLAAIGPSIGECCYEVGQDVYEIFLDKFKKYTGWYRTNENKYMLNLRECNSLQLTEGGIKTDNIYVSNLCTSCNERYFYSYRRDGKTGLHCAIIMLR